MKFAFVTPRYGAEISSGPEHACRLLAEQVSARHDVEVLTTCATDGATWKNELSEGSDRVRGALVRRFAVAETHDPAAFQQLGRRLAAGPRSRAEELEWVGRLGPVTPGLVDHLKRQQRSYDALVFFSLCHWTTVHGVPIAPERTVVFPYLQLRPWLRFGLWAELLAPVRGIGYVSASERRLLRSYLRVTPHHEEVVGIGIEALPLQTYPRHQQDPADTLVPEGESADQPEEVELTYLEGRGVPFRRQHRLYDPFAVYAGPVAPDNGTEEMLEYFYSLGEGDPDSADGARAAAAIEASGGARRAAADEPAAGSADPAGNEPPALDLVLTGVKMMKVPGSTHVRLAGVVPDRDRMAAYQAADVVLVPAPDDLLSQPLLESMAVGTPVLANAGNPSAVEHCRAGNGGLYYGTREEFAETFRTLAGNSRLRRRLGENGRKYIRQNHRWEAVLGRFDRLISKARPR